MCDFPARQLLDYRRSLTAIADLKFNAKKRHAIASTITRIDLLRMAHEDVSDCQCWYDALQQESFVGATR